MSRYESSTIDFQAVARAARRRFVLDLQGVHGVPHWQRVRENGARVAKYSGANRQLIELFALLHDCCREDDCADTGHGERAAIFAESLRGTLLHLPDNEFALLHEAIRDHELGYKSSDATVSTCWDADRLDLGRVGVRPRAEYLCTEYAKRPATILWAWKRSIVD
jgi:uncharacterized protein